jgi:putative NADPH-quinone reductase
VRLLVVHAHPSPDSFNAALCRRVTETLLDGGHVVDLVDLHAADFGRAGSEVLADQRRRVAAADGLIFVHPTWWGGQPAILKRWFDEVLCEGVAYRRDGRGRRRSLLRHIRLLVVVTTYGSSRWVNLLEGEPGRRTARWGLRALLGWRTRSRWLACYRMDAADEETRRRFVDRVGRELDRIAR